MNEKTEWSQTDKQTDRRTEWRSERYQDAVTKKVGVTRVNE